MVEGFARYDYAYRQQGWTVQNPTVGFNIDTYVAPGLPSDVAYVVVFGKFEDSLGRPLSGVVRVRTNKPLVHTTTGTRVMPGVSVLRFNHGQFTLVLPATDDPQLTPAFTYQMKLTVAGYEDTFAFSLPTQADPVNVLDLMGQPAAPISSITIETDDNSDGVVLGSSPQRLTVKTVAGADFITSLESTEAWTATATEVYLLFDNDERWDAVLDGRLANFEIDKAQVAEVPNGTKVALFVVDDDREMVWAVGRLVKNPGVSSVTP